MINSWRRWMWSLKCRCVYFGIYSFIDSTTTLMWVLRNLAIFFILISNNPFSIYFNLSELSNHSIFHPLLGLFRVSFQFVIIFRLRSFFSTCHNYSNLLDLISLIVFFLIFYSYSCVNHYLLNHPWTIRLLIRTIFF